MVMMLVSVIMVMMAASASAYNATDPASLQLRNFKQNNTSPIGILSTSSGCPVQYGHAVMSKNSGNEYFLDSMTHLLSERTPERLVHAKGAGAFGYFEVSHDVSILCKAKFLDRVGKRTRVAVRFSPVVPAKGGSDLAFAVRGFAVKFYTEDGNFDLPGFNIPVFITQDPIKFSSFSKSFKNNPVHNLVDNNMTWDFITLNPESFFANLIAFSDRGIPQSNGRMTGYGVHTMQLSNRKNETTFARFYFKPDLGVKNLLPEKALKIRAKDPDYLTRELYNAIARENYPSWTVYMQPITIEDVQRDLKNGINLFDTSREIPEKDYPLRPIGKLILNENPTNYFADVEQLAFCPGNLVPGILGAPDTMFKVRTLGYRTALGYRLGINFNKLPVNLPIGKIFTYNRDGMSTPDENGGGAPNYYPNTFDGPQPVHDHEPNFFQFEEIKTPNFDQAAKFFQQLSSDEKSRTANNIALSLLGVIEPVEKRALDLFAYVDRDLADHVLRAIKNLMSFGSE